MTDSLDMSRYAKQILFEKIGEQGQRHLCDAKAILIGCGALGSLLASTLVRAGLGSLRICDRDYIDQDNLQRQILFDEDDIAANLPKAEAAVRKLRRINSSVRVEACVIDVNHTNIADLASEADLLLDGTDNFEARFLINDLAVKTNRPWIYGAVIGANGLVMPIIPHDTPCLQCVFDKAPPPEFNPTCDTAGVLGPAVNLVASYQAMEAIKILSGCRDEVTRRLIHIDAWNGRVAGMNVDAAGKTGLCKCCKQGIFEYLDGQHTTSTATLCGRDAVQIGVSSSGQFDFTKMADKLERIAGGTVNYNQFMLRAAVESYELTLFPDGRAIIKGTDKPETARSVYAKYLGS